MRFNLIAMLKRAISYIWSTEKSQVSKAMEHEYEKWSRAQLIDRIKELEAPVVVEKKPPPQKKKPKKAFDFSKHNTRFIALKFAYLGWNYSGLSFQNEPTPLPTIEQEILQALALSKLIELPDPYSCTLSRCGRTDKGVSAMNQVISLRVRSNLPLEQHSKEFDDKEIPYITILNSILPADIRITAVCLRPPPDFDARFSCDYRHYKYLFKKGNLDLDLMQQAATKYEGRNDYRNFCKIDGSKQITNYVREVHSAKIVPFKDDYFAFDLKGSAFLWHQVRCMMAILLLVGQKLEPITVVDTLLNIDENPCRPHYGMAHDLPLVLYDCVYPEMEWIRVTNPKKLTRDYGEMRGLVLDYQVKAHMATLLENAFVSPGEPIHSGTYVNAGDGKGRAYKKYLPVMEKELGEHYTVVNERHKQKKKKRKLEESL